MNANQLKNILCSIKDEFGTEVWDAALALMTVKVVAEAPKKAKVAADGSEKPKRVLTAEHKAAMQAGRQKAKAAKEAQDSQELPGEKIVAEKPAVGSEKPKRVLTEEHKAKMQAGRIAKKAVKAEPVKAEPVVAEQFPVAEKIEVAGKTYILLADGACYEPSEIEGELGAWVGLFKNGVLDTTVQEN